MFEFTQKYTAIEIETIVHNAMLTAKFTYENEVKDFASNGISSRNNKRGLGLICNIFHKVEDEKTRKIALFAAAKDSERSDLVFNNEMAGISTLAGLLKKYRDKKIDADELIIPMALCRNRGVIHWNLLYIKKKDNTYTATCYEPDDEVSPLSKEGISYFKQRVNDYFNCDCKHIPTRQLNRDKNLLDLNAINLSGLCTAENIISLIFNKSFNSHIHQSLAELTKKHSSLCKGPLDNYNPHPTHSDQLPWGAGTEVEHTMTPELASSIASSSSTPLSENSQSPSVNPETAEKQILPFTRSSQNDNSSTASLTSYTLDLEEGEVFLGNLHDNRCNAHSANNAKVSEPITSPPTNNIHNNVGVTIKRVEDSLAYNLLVRIQQEIMNKEDSWGTKLGGKDIHFSWPNKNTHEVIRRTATYSVPHGVKLMLDEIQKAQDIINNPVFPATESKENACKNAFIEIKRIAEERLNKPSFNVWFFGARSDTTTQFYRDIIQKYDPQNIIKASMPSQTSYIHLLN